jgi:hypothetical protein
LTCETVQGERLGTPRIAPDSDAAHRVFRVIHPFHPLSGREFSLVTYRHNWGEDRVYFHDDGGKLASLPARWTDVLAPDPVAVVSGGRSAFRVEDLLGLVDLIERLGKESDK